jgi:hypothetical protein
MVAYTHARRRSARATVRRWSARVILSVIALGAVLTAARGALWLYDARPAPAVVTVTVVEPVPTVVPYRPAGPDPSLPAVYVKPLEIPLPPRTTATVHLHLGPDDRYAIIGTLQAGALVEVAGRDGTSEWLAIVFPPGSTLRAWLPAAMIEGVASVEALPEEPLRNLH